MSFFGPTSPPLLDESSAPMVRRALSRARVVGSFAFGQAGVQLISFLSGILLVRYLDQREYAYFTIANTMQGTINVLADVGISVGLVSIGGHVWQDRSRFGQLITTALRMRRRLGLLAAVVVTPLLYFMLVKNGASTLYALTLIAVVLGGLAVQLSVGVLSVVPRLHSRLGRIQLIDMTGAVVRLAAILALLLIFMNASVAIAISCGALLLQYWMLRKYVAGVVDLHAPENDEDRATIRGLVRKQAANAIFFCVQGQITVFLISFFGTRAGAVAEVGALGRLAMIFAVLGNLLTNVFAPLPAATIPGGCGGSISASSARSPLSACSSSRAPRFSRGRSSMSWGVNTCISSASWS
jgi:O-antigen/teichoic acid export membrane protein